MKLSKSSAASLQRPSSEHSTPRVSRAAADSLLRHTVKGLLARLEDLAADFAILLFRALLHTFLLWRVELRNEEALKSSLGKSALLVANHTSHLDFIVLNALFKQRYGANITFLAKKELGESWLWRLLIRYGNSIPVDREKFGIGTLRAMKGVLSSGGFLGMFPELSLIHI